MHSNFTSLITCRAPVWRVLLAYLKEVSTWILIKNYFFSRFWTKLWTRFLNHSRAPSHHISYYCLVVDFEILIEFAVQSVVSLGVNIWAEVDLRVKVHCNRVAESHGKFPLICCFFQLSPKFRHFTSWKSTKSIATAFFNQSNMNRRPQGYSYEPVPQSQHDDLEVENERMAEDLKNKISSLKSLTIDIGKLAHRIHCWVSDQLIPTHFVGNEVRYQDKLMNDLDDDMNRTGGFMQGTLNRVLRLNKNKRGYTCYMLLFALLVFFILYIVLKFRWIQS